MSTDDVGMAGMLVLFLFPIIVICAVICLVTARWRWLKRRQQQMEQRDPHATKPPTPLFERIVIALSTFIILVAVGFGCIFLIGNQIDKTGEEKVRQMRQIIEEFKPRAIAPGATDARVCGMALQFYDDEWEQDPKSSVWVDEARNRGLKLNDCVKLLKANEAIRGRAFGTAPDTFVCSMAIENGSWHQKALPQKYEDEAQDKWVDEARERRLTLEDCENAANFETGIKAFTRGDATTALQEWRPLADQGVGEAQYMLGSMYRIGTGVQQDYLQAYMLFNLAASQGIDQAVVWRENLARRMTRADISKAQRMAREWLEAHPQ